MNPDETPFDSFYGNLFGVRKSVRYHQRRQAFHEWWNTVIIALSFACSASAMAEWSAGWRQLLIGTTSFLLMLNWVVGMTRRANIHAKLCQRFASLEQDMVPFEKKRDMEAEDEERFRRRRLEIEADEPAKIRASWTSCATTICARPHTRSTWSIQLLRGDAGLLTSSTLAKARSTVNLRAHAGETRPLGERAYRLHTLETAPTRRVLPVGKASWTGS